MNRFFPVLFLFLLLLLLNIRGNAQKDSSFVELPDSVLEKKHSPTKATLMSVALPGLGQIYNRKYWKVPIIYAGFGVLTYFIITNTDEYLNYTCAYIESSNGVTTGNYSDLVNKYSTDVLLSQREYYRRNMEISFLLTALWYTLNILDATVDAHLYTFNISDKLTMRIEPTIQPIGDITKQAGGFKLSLHF